MKCLQSFWTSDANFQRSCATLGCCGTGPPATSEFIKWKCTGWKSRRWLRICQQRGSESEPEKSKTQLAGFGRGRGRKWKAGKSTSHCAEKKTAESQQHSHSKQTSNIIKHTERDTLISPAPQEASIFRKSSKCKLIYYRKRSRGPGVQPNSRHQRVKPKLCRSAHRDTSALVSLSQLGAMHVDFSPPTAKLTGMTEFYITTKSITEPTGRSVCAGISSSLLTQGFFSPKQASLEPWTLDGNFRMCKHKSGCFCKLSADTNWFTWSLFRPWY